MNTIDLLGRPEIQLNQEQCLSFIKGKTILVTGAAGSIGSEIVRQLSALSPKEIVLFGHNESGMFFLEKELSPLYPDVKYNIQLGSICDIKRLEQVCSASEPQIVYHAAANKHVPLSETNVLEAFKTNVIGTENVLRASSRYVENFVFISTDKAVNPSSVMGATKRIAEILISRQSLDEDYFAQWAERTDKYSIVRFGNVLGSSGSVVPIFEKQIKAGGPVTVTDPAMERFFMTIPEASRLVIQASAFNDNEKLYILKMGKQVKIVDIAKRMIQLMGYSLDNIEINYSGIRPGEKLSEELSLPTENLVETKHPDIMQTHFKPYSLHREMYKLYCAEMKNDFQAKEAIFDFIKSIE